jgi:hypothetical protein
MEKKWAFSKHLFFEWIILREFVDDLKKQRNK